MAQTIPSQTRFPTPNQNPEKSILDYFDKQFYLGNGFSVPFLNTNSSTSQPLVMIQNPATNTKTSIFLKTLQIYTDNAVTASFYLNPTITSNGTLVTPVNLRPANANLSNALCYASPSVSSNGTLVSILPSPDNYGGIIFPRLLILDPGQTLMIVSGSGSANFFYNIHYYEL